VFQVPRWGVLMIQERKLCCRRWIVKPNDRSGFEILLPLQNRLKDLSEDSERFLVFPCHSRAGGNPENKEFLTWIPACAGMTKRKYGYSIKFQRISG
jgi:hypothetical protein